MKKFLLLIASIVMILVGSSISFASDDVKLISSNPMLISSNDVIKVQLDGEYIDFVDASGDVVNPQIINDRTMVPFRKIFTSLGVEDENINWIKETRTAVATKDNMKIELQIDNNIAKKTVDGETQIISLDSAPVIVDGRTLVPARFIAESMGKKVGWDKINRTVIIIDEEKLNNDLKEAMPKYMDIVTSQTTPLKTFDATVDLDAEIKYKDSDNKSNNTNIVLNGKIDMIKTEDSIYMAIDAKLTGKGDIYEEIKEEGIDKIKLELILAENKVFIKSPLLLGQMVSDKWVMTEDDSVKELFKMLNASYSNPASLTLLNIEESDMSIYTYESMKLASNMLEVLFNDKNIKVSGTSTKKYEMTIDLIDFLMQYGGEELELPEIEAKMKLGGTISNGVAKKGNVEMTLEYAEGTEEITLELDATSNINSYNKTYKVEIPSESDIISE